MAVRERQADFADGSVESASIARRPDAIVPLVAMAFGPSAVGDIAEGLIVKGWYARASEDGIKVYLCPSEGAEWGEETEILDLSEGAPAEALSLTFDAAGRPVLVVEAGGNLYVRFWTGGSYTYAALGAGASPQIVHQAPSSALWAEIVLLYESGTSIMYRLGSEDYATEWDTGYTMAADTHIEKVLLDADNRIHLILSTRTVATGQYATSRITSESSATPPCIEGTNIDDRIDAGIDTFFIFRRDGEVRTTCEIEVDVLLIGAGGDGGVGRAPLQPENGGDTIWWASEDGVALDPDVDIPPAAHKAIGGGAGGMSDHNGQVGGSGGGGGAQSPSGNAMWSTPGHGTEEQGYPGGGGRSTWGIMPIKRASAGGGGGFGGPGVGGSLWPEYGYTGRGGIGGVVPVWGMAGPAGGHGGGSAGEMASTGPIGGGGGAGGVLSIVGFLIQPGQTIPVSVGQKFRLGVLNLGWPGEGGDRFRVGRTGAAIIRVRVQGAQPTGALISGATAVVRPGDGYEYHVFEASGTLTVISPGYAEALVIGGGGGGGVGPGAGGGGGEVRIATVNLMAPLYNVVVGAGGLGGGVGNVMGENGEDSSIGTMIVAWGGGGGGGGGPGAADGSGLSRATGGGGLLLYADDIGGAGAAMRGYGGGDGGGYNRALDNEYMFSGGGGGGAGGAGDQGAISETTGDELSAADWEMPSTGAIYPAERYWKQIEGGGSDHALINKHVALGKMLIQGSVNSGHSNLDVGVLARGVHPTGDPEEAPTGYHAALNHQNQQFAGGTYLFDLGTWHDVEAYAEDSIQRYAVRGLNGSPRALSTVLRETTDAALNGTLASFGFRCRGTPITGTNKQGYCRNLYCFRDRYLEIGNAPAGATATVLDTGRSTVATGVESGGKILIDLSMYGLASGLRTPYQGWSEVSVLTSGGSVLASHSGSGVYPGGQWDLTEVDPYWNGYGWLTTALVVRIDESGDEPVPVDGLLWATSFSEKTPGPTNGDGGIGVEAWPEFCAEGGYGDEGYFGGGGGGSASDADGTQVGVIAGVGGLGGGADGRVGYSEPSGIDGTDLTGGGGGGASAFGGAGGKGLVVIRVGEPPPVIPAGMLADLNALDLTGLADNEVMTGWPDSSVEGNDLTATGSPTYKAAGINGHPAVQTGVNNYFAFLSAILNGETEGEIIAVMQADNDPAAAANQSGIWHFSASDYSAHHPYTDGKTYEAWGRGTRLDLGNLAQALTSPHVYDVVSAAGEYTVRINGVVVYTSPTNTPTFLTTAPLIGKSKLAYFFAGKWGRILPYARRLEVWERNDAHEVLAAEWGIT